MQDPIQEYWKETQKSDKDLEWWLKPKKEVIELAKTLKQGKILDIGCGMGRHTVLLARMGFNVVGFDAAKDAVEYTKEWLKKENLKADVSIANFLDWDYGENKYDGILSINSFHHAKEQEVRESAKKIAKSLKKGGIFLANVPAFRSIKENEEQIESHTMVPLDGPEKGIPHFLFSKEQVFEFFPDFEITIKSIKLGNSSDEHFDIYAKKN